MPPTQRALPAQARAARNARPSPTELGGGQSADGASARKRSLSLTRDGDARSDGTRVCSVRAVVDATLSELRGRHHLTRRRRATMSPRQGYQFSNSVTTSPRALNWIHRVAGWEPAVDDAAARARAARRRRCRHARRRCRHARARVRAAARRRRRRVRRRSANDSAQPSATVSTLSAWHKLPVGRCSSLIGASCFVSLGLLVTMPAPTLTAARRSAEDDALSRNVDEVPTIPMTSLFRILAPAATTARPPPR